MKDTVLIVMDVQEALVSDDLYNKDVLLSNIKSLIAASKENNIEVVYVRHNGCEGRPMEQGKPGWQIYHELTPMDGEKIFNKSYGSAFKETGLKEYLNGKGIENVIISGLMTNYCVDTTSKAAFEHGFNVIIPKGANSTYDNELLTADKICSMYEDDIWLDLADVMPVEDVIKKYIR